MRKRIWRMSEDRFREEAPVLEFDRDKIEVHIVCGEDAEGEFVIRSTNDVTLRGIVYSSNPYVTVPFPNFEGKEIRVRFVAKTKGFREDDRIKGELSIVCNQTESTIPYEIIVDKRYPALNKQSESIRTLEQFTEICKEHPRDALMMFNSEDFSEFMDGQGEKLSILYRGFAMATPSAVNLESFLVAAGLKERVGFTLTRGQTEFYEITENCKEVFTVTKNNWGYFKMNVHCDCDFLTVEPSSITPDFFLGSRLDLSCYIHFDKLHDGINRGSFTIETTGYLEKVDFLVSTNPKEKKKESAHIIYQKRILRLLQIYEDFRLRNISIGSWCDDSIAIVEDLLDNDPDSHFLKLFKAQAYIVNGRRQEALWIISDEKKTIENKKSFDWAYLLYVCTLIEPEESYVNKLTAEIEGIFRLYPEDYRIFWFLLFLRKEYLTDTKRKLTSLRQWIDSGNHSPILYLEVLELISQDPLLIRKLDDFSIKMLMFAMRKQKLTRSMVIQFSSLVSEKRTFDKRIYRLLVYGYETYMEEDVFEILITYLLRTPMLGEEYRRWYDIAIEKEMLINGLYEAFLDSTPLGDIRMLPKRLLMYFEYQNTLPYERKAFLYANIITYKDRYEGVYESYHRQIEDFALECLRHEKIDDNLAIIYQNMLNEGLIDEDIASRMARLFYVKKVVCLNVNAIRVMVLDEKAKEPFVAPVHDNIAFVRILGEKARVFLDTSDEGLVAEDTTYYIQPLLQGQHILEQLKKEGKSTSMELFLEKLSESSNPADFIDTDIELIRRFIADSTIRLEYKKQKYPLLLSVLKAHTREDILSEELISLKDDVGLSSDMVAVIIEQMINDEQYQRAYEKLKVRNGQLVPMNMLLRLCNEIINDETDNIDDFLIRICAYLLDQFLSSEKTLLYLTKYYTGPTRAMISLWKYSAARALDTKGLEERILTQILYVGGYYPDIDDIFNSYIKRDANRMLVEAYVNFYAHGYLIYGKTVPKSLFSYIQLLYTKGNKLSDSMRIALSRHLTLASSRSDKQNEILEDLIRENVVRNQYFAYYRNLSDKLIIKYHLYDKMFAEYKDEHGLRLVIVYSKDNEDEVRRDMIEMYDGIYVHEFVIFFGETIEYRIITADDGEEKSSGKLSYLDVIESGSGSRYARLNQISSDVLYQNERDLIGDMKDYKVMLEVSRTLFPTIVS
ncbi:MAG: DUF5717 family protein [Lachnospiraceae bacterium]|nr:DUF5717 family protein [Lachnospiraceae bacterium]